MDTGPDPAGSAGPSSTASPTASTSGVPGSSGSEDAGSDGGTTDGSDDSSGSSTGELIVPEYCDVLVPDDAPTIQGGIEMAFDLQTVCIMPGTYNEDLYIDGWDVPDITIEGIRPRQTTIEGTGTVPTVYMEDWSGALRQLTITGGVGTSEGEGGGIHADGGSPLLERLIVTENHIERMGETEAAQGGGMFLFNTEATVRNCVIANNSVNSHYYARAAGVFAFWGHVVFENVLIANNTSSRYTGGVDLYGGGNGLHTLRNAVIVGNVAALSGGGVFANSGQEHVIENVTIVGNTADQGAGAYFYIDVELSNAVIALNEGTGVYADEPIGLRYSDLWGNTEQDYDGWGMPIGMNENISRDPQLVDTDAGDALDWDVALGGGSPCIDGGDPAILDADGSRSDMGAFGGPGAELWDLP